ncbi:hypothetical protein AHF37_01888 [Paragonimus kellicotti]|nr:hypothetical protein AHF37_01888 [Paragonimus kellicotti]
MAPLSPLEFRDCVVDGPHFRAALHKHEKGLKASSKQVKDVYLHAERVFKAMEQLHSAVCDFAVSISTFSAGTATPPPDVTTGRQSGKSDGRATPEVAETDDEVTMKTAFAEFAKIIQGVEEARSTMLEPIRTIVLTEINELRTVWLAGQKVGFRTFFRFFHLKTKTIFFHRIERNYS